MRARVEGVVSTGSDSGGKKPWATISLLRWEGFAGTTAQRKARHDRVAKHAGSDTFQRIEVAPVSLMLPSSSNSRASAVPTASPISTPPPGRYQPAHIAVLYEKHASFVVNHNGTHANRHSVSKAPIQGRRAANCLMPRAKDRFENRHAACQLNFSRIQTENLSQLAAYQESLPGVRR